MSFLFVPLHVYLASGVSFSDFWHSILNYHHPRQVYIGFGIGFGCAVAYFFALSVGRHLGLVDYLLDTPIARWVRLRDLLANEDMVDAGWERWELRRSQRKTKQKASKQKKRA